MKAKWYKSAGDFCLDYGDGMVFSHGVGSAYTRNRPAYVELVLEFDNADSFDDMRDQFEQRFMDCLSEGGSNLTVKFDGVLEVVE